MVATLFRARLISQRINPTKMLRRAALSSVRSVSRRSSVQGLKALTSSASHAPKLSGARPLARQRPVQAAHFSSDASAPSVQMPEREFVELADETLHDIQNWLDGIEEMLDESDVMFSVRDMPIARPLATA